MKVFLSLFPFLFTIKANLYFYFEVKAGSGAFVRLQRNITENFESDSEYGFRGLAI